MKNFIVCIAIIVFGFGQNVFGCKMKGKSLSKFDYSEYIFIGKVVGYTDAVKFDEARANNSVEPLSYTDTNQSGKRSKETVGLAVKVIDSVYLPKVPAENFEIFLYDLIASCSVEGKTLDDLKRLFPIDTEVRVIAKVAEFVPRLANDKTIQLEVRPSEPNSIIANTDKSGIRMTSGISVFIYKDYSYDMNGYSVSNYLLPSFEVRKDLLRLEQAKTQLDRNAILDRLFHAPSNSDLYMSGLFNTYAGSQAEADRMFESHLKATSPETYEQYMIVKKTLDELIKRGFDKKLADEAIGMALSEGTDFEPAKLVKRAAEILGASKKRIKP